MRSLATKLTLSFLAIGVLGALLVALITGYRIRQQFTNFLGAQSADEIAGQLSAYYSTVGSWDGVEGFIADTPELAPHAPFFTILDPDEAVVFQMPRSPALSNPTIDSVDSRTALTYGDQTVGTLLIFSADTALNTPGPPPPEDRFLRDAMWATVVSALIAGLVALVAGYLLARALTRPIRDLTNASQQMAAGELGTQVEVRSNDEIGRLAVAFNQMSSDLASASQARKQLTADIAHDLRTPLSILRGYMEGLKDGELTGSPHLYGIMFEEVEQLDHLVGDLRTLSLADAGELTLNRRPVDPRALLERVGLAYVMQAEQRGIVLRVEAVESLPMITVDVERMTQLLKNLVSNALRHVESGEIVLSAVADDVVVTLRVSDTGSGIDPADLPHIFDRFYRADKSRQRGAAGTTSSGLGLAIAKAIVAAHGGTISAESQVGHGTTFSIALPIAAESTGKTVTDPVA